MLAQATRVRAPAITAELRRRVVDGQWQPRQQINTEHELAREFGVSRGTVIRSLRQLEGEGLLWSRRGGGRYVADPTQRTRTGMVAVVASDLDPLRHPVLAMEVAGMRQVAVDAQYNMQIFALHTGDVAAIDPVLAQLDPARMDGVVILQWAIPDDKIVEVSRRMPVVWSGRCTGAPRAGTFTVDLLGCTMDATNHLLDLGHRDVMLVTIGENRLQGLNQREGVRVPMRKMLTDGTGRMRVISARSNMSAEWVETFRRQLADPPTAIIFGSDDLALRGMKVMSELKLQIPRDISVISTNDTLAPPAVPVPMSTIQPDYESLGRGAMQLLLEMLDQPVSAPPPSTRLAPATFVPRESTVKPRTRIN